jgi:hypothetical protein
MSVPRALKGTGKLYDLLDQEPPEPLVRLAVSWVGQGHTESLYEKNVIMELTAPHEHADAGWLIDAIGVDLERGRSGGVEVLRGPLGHPPSRSHAAGVRWVFALVWIFSTRFRSVCS